MSRTEKLLQRLLSAPNDFTWEELTKIFAYFGYGELKKGKTGGSRRKFADANNHIFIIHQPHPRKIVKNGAIHKAITFLTENGHIKNE
jgi:hypothetical protein